MVRNIFYTEKYNLINGVAVRMSVRSLKNFGGVFLSPLLSFFNENLNKISEENDKLFFLAREGYWLKKSYDAYQEASGAGKGSSYLLVSRAFLFKIGLIHPKTWQYSLDFEYKGSLYELMKTRFMISDMSIVDIFSKQEFEKTINLPADLKKIEKILIDKQAKLQVVLQESNQAYRAYLDKIGFFSNEKAHLVDVGYSGTIQTLLTLIYQKDTVGHYLIASKPGKKRFGEQTMECKGYLNEGAKLGDGYVPLDRSMLIESLLTAPVGQFQDMRLSVIEDKSFDFYYGREVSSQHYFYLIEQIMEGALTQMKQFLSNGVTFNENEIETLLKGFLTKKGMIPRASWPIFEIDDDTANEGTLNTLEFWGLKS